MHYQLIISPQMSRAIGAFGLSRDALLAVLNMLYLELEEHAANHRHHRDSAHPELYFSFEVTVWDKGKSRGFRFTVDDARATDRLFLVAAEEI